MSDINNYNKTNTISPERYVFWMNDITVLYTNNNFIKFVPTSDMTRVEQLNALTRFFLYLLVILFMFDKTDEFMYVPIVGLILIIILYNVFEMDENGKRQELIRMKRNREKLRDVNKSELNYRTYQIDNDGDIITVDIDQEVEKQENLSQEEYNQTDYELEAGIYDSENKIQTGKYRPAVKSLSQSQQDENIKYTLDEIRTYQKAKKRKPTTDNPYVNPSVADFNTENLLAEDIIPAASNADDEDIKNDMVLKFNEDIYRDIEDVFDKQNSQRQFYTIAHNIPNDQEAFARWCYKFPTTCKTNQERCLRYEDLRTKY